MSTSVKRLTTLLCLVATTLSAANLWAQTSFTPDDSRPINDATDEAIEALLSDGPSAKQASSKKRQTNAKRRAVKAASKSSKTASAKWTSVADKSEASVKTRRPAEASGRPRATRGDERGLSLFSFPGANGKRSSLMPAAYTSSEGRPRGARTSRPSARSAAFSAAQPGPLGNPFVDDDQAGNPMVGGLEPIAGGAGCTDCQAGCTGCQASGQCCTTGSSHQTKVFGDYLYLRASNAGVAYAAEVDGPPSAAANRGTQVGRTAVVDHDYDSGYRAGFAINLDECSSIQATYTEFNNSEGDQISRSNINDIRSLVTHPLTTTTADDWLDATATHDIGFDLADLEYRWLFRSGCNYELNFSIGGRYGHLDQTFRSTFSGNGFRQVETDLTFEGGGIRFGADFERRSNSTGLLVYGRGGASFLAGEVQGEYRQRSSFDTALEIDTTWSHNRVATILEAEVGLGWQSHGGNLRVTAGYLFNAWMNSVTTDEFVDAVHFSDFDDLGETITFDGLAIRGELRF